MRDVSSKFSFPSLQGKVKILRGNSIYRIGDIIYKKGATWRYAAEEILSKPSEFNETVLFKYLSENGIDTPPNLRLFYDTLIGVGDKKEWSKPEPEDLVMHVRLGDVLDPKNPIGPERIFHYYGNFFANFTNKSLKATRLVVCTAIHYCDYGGLYDYDIISEVNSRQLLSNIFFEGRARSLKIDVYSNDNIDMDFYYLCNARRLALSMSDYSLFAAQILKANGIEARILPYIYNLHSRHKSHVNWDDSARKEKEILGLD